MDSYIPELRIVLPAWVGVGVDFDRQYAGDAERMAVAIELARENVLRESGGPFGAAIFEADSGRLVSVGINLVVAGNNSVLHAEMLAFMLAQARVGAYTLNAPGLPEHVLYTSCEPCAMCLGATQWSGVRRVVFAATRDDASELFDEGPVFPASYDYLEERGITFTPRVLRDEGRAVLRLYRERGGRRYNG